MSERDKKLLVYLGSLIILAAAYFLVGRPYLDKIDAISTENDQLEMDLKKKQAAKEKSVDYQNDTIAAKERIASMIDKFPADNTDEKSIMFVVNMEKDIPVWINNVKFADEEQDLVNSAGKNTSDSTETTDATDASTTESEEQTSTSEEAQAEVEGETEVDINSYIGKDTEIGLAFTADYETFKSLLGYIRDYKDRMVIKELNVSYDKETAMTVGSMIVSQYAILASNRQLPDIETGIEKIGTSNVFSATSSGRSIIGTILNEIANASGLDSSDSVDTGDTIEGADYFAKISAVTDNTDAITLGRQGDVPGSSYVISKKNENQKVYFNLSGEDGEYTATYKVGDSVKTETFTKSPNGIVKLDIVSSERMNAKDKVGAEFHITNDADLPLIVKVEGEDNSSPRVDIVEKNGNVTVRE